MGIKKMIAIIPKSLLIFLFITLLVSSLEGVVNSGVIGYLPNFTQNSSVEKFIQFICISILAYSVVYVAIWLHTRIQNRIIYLLNTQLKSDYIKRATFERIDTNTELSALINDFKLIETNYFNLLVEVVADLCMSLFSTIFILRLNVTLGIVFIVFALPQLFVSRLFQPLLSVRSAVWSKNNGKFVEKMRDLLGGRETILRYGAFEPIDQKINDQLAATERSYQSLNNGRMNVQIISWLCSLIALFLPVGFGFYLMIDQQSVTSSIILSIYLASGQVMQPLREAINDFATIKTTIALRQSINDVLSKRVVEEKPQITSDKATINKIAGEGITFSFGKKTILDHAQFIINQGDKILLTGASGTGKSTIFNLIMGTLHPAEGKLAYRVDGQAQPEINPAYFALIQQSPYIFNETIRFNLSLGLMFPDELLITCLREVGLDQELGGQPLEYVCQGNGCNLSGGQCERLEIARALVFNRQIISADEIDANLAPANALQVEKMLASINKTVIMISHHINYQRAKDLGFRHWVLENNKLIEIK